ncbi:hypothetical protein KC315_g6176 [Hortaea werneckii]|uniref:Rhodopsin domain-containing protein n=1 Tax=Hortaea werneckii TaxID=91943 RepID=A0A3M7E7A6_HORWE|nr:hypothetical protein KC315_g6176 [Hortaea werneckii]KAI7355293.1 hypothetical protein KC354_g10859 [Hortaea werneckii]RMY72501.1 hypothetical protein D0863_04478 [Hortaea werneckii]
MRSTQAYHDDEYLREVWILYGIGVLIYFLRFCVRLRTVGIRHFQGDDWTSIAVLLFYTADAVTVTFTYLLGSNVDWPPEKLDQFNAQQIDNIILGSKLQLVAWYTYTALIWGLKACMLFFFNRLTFGLNVQTYVKILAVACGATYIAVFLTISVGCHPIQKNWAVDPYPPAECTLRSQNMYVTTVLNVTTDAAMLCIPLPILWKLKVPLRKKITLAALLSSGIFVITAAIVRIVMTLKAHPSALTINRWGVRETIAGILAVNIPILRPLFTKPFWTGEMPGSEHRGARSRQNDSSKKTGRSSKLASSAATPGSYEMDDASQSTTNLAKSKSVTTATVQRRDSDSDHDGDTASEDCIIRKSDRGGELYEHDQDIERGHDHQRRLEVTVDTTYDVRPASAGAVAELEGESDTPRHRRPGLFQGRFWDRRYNEGEYGNSVTIGSGDYR